MNVRDMSQAQFDAKCREYGFRPTGFLGYYDVGEGLNVSILNAGTRRRAQLAYLIREHDKYQSRGRKKKQ